MNNVAIPLPNGRITKIRVQKNISDYFVQKKIRKKMIGKLVQKKISDYFIVRPKAPWS